MSEPLWIPSPEDAFRVPEPIKRAARLGDLVVFVGAGVSALCDSPLWDAFANRMIDQLGGAGTGGLSFLEREQLKAIPDARRRASIAVELAREKGVALEYSQMLHPDKPSEHGLEAYRLLAAMNPVFVTTNYDTWLDVIPPQPITGASGVAPEATASGDSPRRAVYSYRSEFTVDRLNEQGAVIHLHGSCNTPDSMVVSLRDYIQHYATDYVQTFLTELLRTRSVLFIGYSLSELELLEYIVKFNTERAERRHFLLYAYRSTEITQLRFLKRFFEEQCGIGLIPYCIDDGGFAEIVGVLRRWHDQLEIRSPVFIDRQAQIDRALTHPEERPRREATLHMIQEDEELATYFFSRVDRLEWLEDLHTAGFFNPDRNPTPTLVPDGQYWEIRSWSALQYLERAAQQANQKNDIASAKRIIDTITAITSRSNERGVDNPHTWAALAGALVSLPLQVIEPDHIELARTWLNTRFDAAFVGRALGGTLLPRLLESDDSGHHQKAALLLDVLTMMKGLPDA